MKIIISPSKSLDLETSIPTNLHSEPKFLGQAQKIMTLLKKKSQKKIGELMSISPTLSELNYQRNQNWNLPFTENNARQAVYTFKGDVYAGLDALSIPKEKLKQLEEKVRILSGLYGILKPFDLIQAYRLEMGTKIKIGKKDNLYEFWGDKITNLLNSEMKNEDILVNLASSEYYKAINPKLIKVPIITPEFKDYKDGKLKSIGFFIKKARGMMVRYIIDYNIDDAETLKGFNYGNYGFSEELSSKTKLVFVR